jgi:DNA-binding protein YbaB
MIKITVTGAGVAKKVFIDDSLINKDEKEILEDLLIAAFNDAKNKADEGSSDSMKSVTGGINLPAGFKI